MKTNAGQSPREPPGNAVRRAFFPPLSQQTYAYSPLGAPTGQTSAQLPHSVQTAGSMTYLPSPSEIADTGHSASHAPHAMQSSLIVYAIEKHLLIVVPSYHSKKPAKLQRVSNGKSNFSIENPLVLPRRLIPQGARASPARPSPPLPCCRGSPSRPCDPARRAGNRAICRAAP